MSQKRDWLRNAFAVNPHLEPPSAEQRALLEKISREIVVRRMIGPALAFLEMSRPLNFLGAQAMHFFAPLWGTVFDTRGYEEFSRFLERRDAIDLWCDQIEAITNESTRAPESDVPAPPVPSDPEHQS